MNYRHKLINNRQEKQYLDRILTANCDLSNLYTVSYAGVF